MEPVGLTTLSTGSAPVLGHSPEEARRLFQSQLDDISLIGIRIDL
jgi:hypothetical protein